jgi:hypothetical protein
VKITGFNVGIILVVVICVAIAGCTGSNQPAGGSPPTTGGQAAQGTVAPAGGSAPQAGSVVSGASIFGGATSYNWIEYKMTTSGMTAYMKMEKSGKCTMRMEGKDLPGGSMTVDCSSKGGQAQQAAQSNPNDVKSDVQFTFAGIEPVTVPAGTYPTASKYTLKSQGITTTYWTAPGVPGFVKTVSGDVAMELNGWG